MNPIVIVGSGLAGYGLVRELRKRDPVTPVTLVSADDGRVYTKPGLSNALAQGRRPEQLAAETAAQAAARFQAKVISETRVTAIDARARTLHTDREPIAYDRLVLAVGADPLDPGLAGSGAGAVLSVNDLADYSRFRVALADRERVAILGGGLIGCEFANDLAATGHAVSVVHRGRWPLDRLVPEVLGRELATSLEKLGVQWHLGQRARQVEKRGAGYRLILDEGSSLDADLILSAIGLRPRTALAEAAGLAVRQGIVVDRQLRSSDPRIYAVGDCAEVDGLVLPFVKPLMAQVRTLAAVLAGEPARLVYPAMPVLVKTPAWPLLVAPPPAGAAGEWQVVVGEKGSTALFRGLDGRLLGFALSGAATAKGQELAVQLPPLLA